MNERTFPFFGITVSSITYEELISHVHAARAAKKQVLITYLNQHVANLLSGDECFRNAIAKFHIIHPDGVGIWLALKFLFGSRFQTTRMTGSDFYSILLSDAEKENTRFFFFGDTESTLHALKKRVNMSVIAGTAPGFAFDTDSVIRQINSSGASVLLVGIGSPLQEQWIATNHASISVPVIIAVGEGLRVIAGTKKRGPVWIQKLGLEWLIRLLFQPKRLWRRYVLGIPLFVLRVFNEKLNLR
jgi:N-acetylglucosaminyldiphosphoundecaprenol N-acetyl-beta-D-mannosaminyltransferase